ncbi:3-ketoacyl-ACP reductase [Gordoniibacillus kamchatkensis]|uniref:3-ketoacyl-ACP reductase n=1 Tax=Gordoniibacillus kamchatkensis TaxID=1590651 RepID=A0ABR5ACT4_9BACL|nr:SDR family oxidoreductase [Paenibacillus sp. VKM B-2647]KIL38848.1 3-ketoacyl-ACP reductase [Paenibacillus sp. VKM B-2647]
MTTHKGLAVVTGAASGIGKAIAERLAADGYAVAVADLNVEAAARTAEGIRAASRTAQSFAIDVTDKASIQRALDEAIAVFGPLKAWVSNAGVSTMNHFVDLTEEEWDINLNVNAKGPFLCGQVAARTFIEQNQGGKIVNTASLAGKRGGIPFLAHYVASKFAVVGLTQSMAYELAKHRITVNAVCPGYVQTPMQSRELEWEAKLRGVTPDEVIQIMLNETPLQRLQTPADVAKVVSYLLSEDADFITGEAIAVNGGVYMD